MEVQWQKDSQLSELLVVEGKLSAMFFAQVLSL